MTKSTILLFALSSACSYDSIEIGGPCPDCADTGDTGEEVEPCADLPANWPDAAVDCQALSCSIDAGRLTCEVALYLEPGHRGDFAIAAPGDLPWNEWPFNADAGPWEDAQLIGDGLSCGTIGVNIDTLEPNELGEVFVAYICEDSDLGAFRIREITIDAEGVSPG